MRIILAKRHYITDVEKLEAEGYVVIRVREPSRKCEILFPPEYTEKNNGVH